MTTDGQQQQPEQQPEPQQQQQLAVVAGRALCELFNGGGGVHEDMLLRHCLGFLHLWEISRIGPTVSKAWLRCVEERCWTQLAAPGRELELRAKPRQQPAAAPESLRLAAAEEEKTLVARVIVPLDEEDRAALHASEGLRVVVYPGVAGGGRSRGIALTGRHAALARDPRSSSVIVRREDVKRLISPVASPAIEAWVREELTEGTKPLAMDAVETLGVFLPFSCRRCGARSAEEQPKQPVEEEDLSAGLSGAVVAGEQTTPLQSRSKKGKSRFRVCALQLRPGVRENLAWVTPQERVRRLECVDCAVLAAVEHRAEADNVVGGSRGGGGVEEGGSPSPWLHIDFHTGAPGRGSPAATERARAAGEQEGAEAEAGQRQGQGVAASRHTVSEWVEARYMGSDEFTTLPRSGQNEQLNMHTNDLQVPG